MSEMMPTVAVLLAAYNGKAYIQLQIESILKQKGVDVSVFISVDKSTDGTFDYCLQLAEADSRIQLLSYGERFGGAAANFFRLIRDVDFSDFDLVALADQDDIWLDDKLLTAHEALIRYKADAYSSNVLAFWQDGRQMVVKKAQAQRQFDHLFEAAGPGCSYVIRSNALSDFKQALKNKAGIAEKIALHDWLIYAYLRTHQYRWFIDENYKMLYRQHQDNQVGVNKGLNAAIRRIKLFQSGWYRSQVKLVGEFVAFTDKNFASRLVVLMNINQLRRKLSDRMVLLLLVLVGAY